MMNNNLPTETIPDSRNGILSDRVLWLEIIKAAKNDLSICRPGSIDYDMSVSFFNISNAHFRFVCMNAGIEPTCVLREIDKII